MDKLVEDDETTLLLLLLEMGSLETVELETIDEVDDDMVMIFVYKSKTAAPPQYSFSLP